MAPRTPHRMARQAPHVYPARASILPSAEPSPGTSTEASLLSRSGQPVGNCRLVQLHRPDGRVRQGSPRHLRRAPNLAVRVAGLGSEGKQIRPRPCARSRAVRIWMDHRSFPCGLQRDRPTWVRPAGGQDLPVEALTGSTPRRAGRNRDPVDRRRELEDLPRQREQLLVLLLLLLDELPLMSGECLPLLVRAVLADQHER
jgi:hypothetical protein